MEPAPVASRHPEAHLTLTLTPLARLDPNHIASAGAHFCFGIRLVQPPSPDANADANDKPATNPGPYPEPDPTTRPVGYSSLVLTSVCI